LHFPSGDEIACRSRPEGEGELKTGGEEAAGNDLAALENELGFGAHEEGADLDHPRGGGEADACAPGFANGTQEVAIGERMGRGEIDDAGKVLGGDEQFDRADEVDLVNPGDELIAGSIGPAEAVANEREEDVEDAAGVGAEGHGAAQSDLSGARSCGREEGVFPRFGDLNGEVPGVGRAGFVAAEFAGGLIHGAIEGVAIDGGGAGVEPDCGRVIELGDDLVKQMRGENAGVEDGPAIGLMVAAVDAAACEVDAGVGAFEFVNPGTRSEAIPGHDTPGSGIGSAAEDGDGVAVCVKVAREDLTDLTGATGDDDLHWAGLSDGCGAVV
jgi:hypothetical protein